MANQINKAILDANQAAQGLGKPVDGVNREGYANKLEELLRKAYGARNNLEVAIKEGEEKLNTIKPTRP